LIRFLLVRSLLLLLLIGFRQFLALISYRHLGAETFVVGILDDLANMNVLVSALAKMQSVIGHGIGRKPVAAIHLLAPSGEFRKKILVTFLPDIGNGLA